MSKILFLSLFFLPCIGCNLAPKVKLPTECELNGVHVRVTGLYSVYPGMRYTGIGGIATNTSDHDLNMCQIKFDILHEGIKVGDALAVTQSLHNSQKWAFQAAMLVPFGTSFDEITLSSVQTDKSLQEEAYLRSQSILRNSHLHQKQIGVFLMNKGFITAVTPNSSADAKGVLAGDRIIKINGVSVENNSSQEITHTLRDIAAVGKVTLCVLRDGQELSFDLAYE